jgi:hypothetical protein
MNSIEIDKNFEQEIDGDVPPAVEIQRRGTSRDRLPTARESALIVGSPDAARGGSVGAQRGTAGHARGPLSFSTCSRH